MPGSIHGLRADQGTSLMHERLCATAARQARVPIRRTPSRILAPGRGWLGGPLGYFAGSAGFSGETASELCTTRSAIEHPETNMTEHRVLPPVHCNCFTTTGGVHLPA